MLGKYKIVQVDGDSQSKADVAINEAERLLSVEKVDILAGIYSSAHAVPIAERVDKQKRFLWITTAIADAVFKDRNLQYTFRPQPNGGLFGVAVGPVHRRLLPGEVQEGRPRSCGWPSSTRTAPTAPTWRSRERDEEAKERGCRWSSRKATRSSAPDLSALVTKLRAARPDVLFHTGYNPDITLFLRQAKEQGLRVRAYIGHGAGHSQLDKLKEAFGHGDRGLPHRRPVASQLIEKKLSPGSGR